MSTIDRIPPQSLEMEQATLGSMMIERAAIDIASDMLRPEDFWREAHRFVFEAILTLVAKKQSVDLLTVQEQLRHQEMLESCGGTGYLIQLMNAVAAPSNVPFYAKVVREKACLRRLLAAAAEIETMVHSEYDDFDLVLAQVEATVTAATIRRGGENAPEHIRAVINDVFEEMEEVWENKRYVTGIPTGIADLDYKTGGFQPGTLTVVGARPGHGKTSLGMHFVLAAAKAKHPVFVASQEMSKRAIVRRAVATMGKVDGTRLRTGFIEDDDWRRIGDSCSRLSQLHIVIAERRMGLANLRSHCMRMAREIGLDMVVVDYLQLMKSDRKRGDNKTAEVTDLAEGLADLSKELNVAIIALSQLSRAVDLRPDHRPVLGDLRESGQIEAAADLVLFPFNPLFYQPDDARKEVEEVEIIVAKQRDGQTGSARAVWMPKYTAFDNPASAHHERAQSPSLPYVDN